MCTPYIESQKWLPWQRPLGVGYQQYLHCVGRPLNPPPPITNCLVVIVHTKPVNSNIVPKLVVMAMSLSTSGSASRSVRPFLHRWLQSVPILYNGAPLFPSKLPLPMGIRTPM